MTRCSLVCARLATALTLGALAWAPTVARATPADVLFVLDTSASMAEPAPGGGGESKLEVARALISRLARAAESDGHRTALLRFRQEEVLVRTGEGPREVVIEAEDECERAADVLVPVGAGSSLEIEEWLDGESGQGLREVEAVGDSPLYGATRVALRYVDGLRALDPQRHCVRALIVIVTDGADTCAGGAELLASLAELEAAAPEEAIQTLVVAFDPDAEAARRLASVGREEAEPRVFSPSEASDLEARLADLDGLAIVAACAAEPAPAEPDAGTADSPDAGQDAAVCVDTPASGGCAVGHARGGALGLGVVAGLALLIARRRRARARRAGWLLMLVLGACALIGCPATPASPCGPTDADVDASVPDAAVPAPVDPELGVERLRERQAIIRAALEAALASTTELVEPERVFAAIEGEPRAGCEALLETVAFEAYAGSQRGVRGCLATRRCNGLDQSLLLSACLAHHGITTELRDCREASFLAPSLPALERETPVFPDTSAVDGALRAASAAALTDLPAIEDALQRTERAAEEYVRDELVARAREDATLLSALTARTAADTATAADDAHAVASTRHHFLVAGTERLDPVLGAASTCSDRAASAALEEWTLLIEVLAQNVSLGGTTFSYRPEVSLGTFEISVPERWGEAIPVVIAGAEASEPPEGLPPPAAASCFRVFVDGAPTASIPLLAGDVSGCGGDTPAPLRDGHGLGRIILRTSLRAPPGTTAPPEVDRILIDRFGEGRTTAEVLANGPSFSSAAARRLVPMRVEVVTGSGLLGPHEELHRAIADRLARFDALIAAPLERLGAAPPPGARTAPAPDFTSATFALFREASATLAEGDAVVGSHAPWRTAVSHRRVHVPGRGIEERHVFDLTDVPLSVTGVAPETRLRLSLELGAALTEAERIAGMSLSRSLRVLSAASLLREPGVSFAPYASPGREAVLFPLGLQEAARTRGRTDELLVTAGTVEQHGTPVQAWWRVDPLGVPIGELRYEGTMYGGTTAAVAVATFVRCLGFQAITALSGPRVAPDVACCARLVVLKVIEDLVTGFFSNAVMGGLVMGMGSSFGEAAEDYAGAAADGVLGGADVAGLIDSYSDPPECVMILED